MEKDLILAIDVGTTYLKVGLVDAKGNILRALRSRIKMETDQTGKAEHNVKQLSKQLFRTAKKVAEGYENRISAIVPSTHIFGLMAVDKNNEPLTNMITLADTRPRSIVDEFKQKFDEKLIYSKTGIPLTFHTSLLKIFWLMKTLGAESIKTAKFISCKGFIISLLTSELVTEYSTASSTGYFNTFRLEWDEDILNMVGIRKENLPDITSPYTILPLSKEVSKYLKLPENTKVVMGVYDGGAVAVAGGIFGKIRKAAVNLGTTGMIRLISDKPIVHGTSLLKLQTLYLCNNKWFTGGSVNNAGSVIEWLKKSLKINLKKFEYNLESENGLLFYPYLTGERGFEFGSKAKGVIYGIELKHSSKDILIAALEGISFTLRTMVEPLLKKGIDFDRITVSGGGTKLKLWMDILANVFNKEVEISQLPEPALVGSMILGATALGWFGSISEATETVLKEQDVIVPCSTIVKKYERKYQRFLDVLERVYSLKR